MTIEDTSTRPAVSRRLYTEEEVLAEELATIFAKTWLLVGFESEVPQPGDYVTRRMGADPVILTRSESGEVHVLHNSCTHRGTQVCKAAFGNSANFRCGYHGWTFGNDGRLRGVPGRRSVYGPDLDLGSLGLRQARVGVLHGLVFATFDQDGPSLEEHLGDFRWYLDRVFGFFPGGMEVYGGAHRVVIRGNWKIHAENFIGDGYHLRIAHRTMFELGVMGKQAGKTRGFCISSPNGHGVRAQYVDDEEAAGIVFGYPDALLAGTGDQDLPDASAFRAASSVIHGTVFPNMPFITTAPVQFGDDAVGQTAFTQVRSVMPVDPHSHEVTYWSLVPKDAPEEWKKQSYLYSIRQHGASSYFEADDLENFRRIDAGLGGPAAADVPLNYDLGVGVPPSADQPPFTGPCTVVNQDLSEVNQRNFYRRYAAVLNGGDAQ
ncbi:aromatic ring-hydroxylating oxygenase subunit alpha [Geodermatophilus sp. CPCC 206100]|uniref:aromatic ring-hydroxylating oxygenase subunit alpha n=1 Tax=Geodermatophilus sp. CPCC 206100 TaxID=3020054 RepID=UPI003AFF9944